MERVSEVLYLPVIIERRRPFSFESQLPEKGDFLLGRIAAEGRILQECFEPWLFVERLFPFHKGKLLHGLRGQPAI
jgi:hypothetical protein